MKSPISNTGVTLKDVLKKKYPDIDFYIRTDLKKKVTEIELTKREKDGTGAMVRIRFTTMAIDISPVIVNEAVEKAVWRLREYSKTLSLKLKSTNPSSRRFG